MRRRSLFAALSALWLGRCGGPTTRPALAADAAIEGVRGQVERLGQEVLLPPGLVRAPAHKFIAVSVTRSAVDRLGAAVTRLETEMSGSRLSGEGR
jgi:hypothetical protein